ncbi:MAG: FAD-dependent oxidoreductase [Puniceicoccaceae bacterium]|nr:MAG: FAD-dependent oxidoreductase [Puniceicoccaceae bacterium]
MEPIRPVPRAPSLETTAMLHPRLRYHQPSRETSSAVHETGLCVYGGTSAGVIAACQAVRSGLKALIVEPGHHLGGMTAGGLSLTDIGNKHAIGGFSREFYRRVGRRYGVEEEWRFEPSAAEAVFQELAAEHGVSVLFGHFIAGAEMEAGRIRSITLENGARIRARAWIDAGYEGDLLAAAGVSFTVGREDNSVYQETLNGSQVRPTHQFDFPVSPYRREGAPASGLLPGIEADEPVEGRGDHRIQAYNFRLCLTNRPDNRRPFPKPVDYDPACYELLARYLRAGWRDIWTKFDPIRGDKVDLNNHGAVSTDFIGANHAFPIAAPAEREVIFQEHVSWQSGLHYFMANDPSVPEEVRSRYAAWGLCADEFTATGGWPHQLYIREARRMIGDAVMTEHHCRGHQVADDPVGLAAYTMDSHNCRRFARDGRVWNEGDVQVHDFPPYPISYRAIIPRRGEAENLLVPCCLSATHIAFGSIRMEPVFMVLGQSAAFAAALAVDRGCPVQEVNYAELRKVLLDHGQILGGVAKARSAQAGE